MANSNGSDLTGYYQYIQEHGLLQTQTDAQRWSRAILRTLGQNLDRSTKKQLAKALPEVLAKDLTRVFWLLHFRDKQMSLQTFLKDIANRSGNTDGSFARHPTAAVFHEIKEFAGQEMSDDVSETLAPEISELWQSA